MRIGERRVWVVAAAAAILAVGILVGWLTGSAIDGESASTPTNAAPAAEVQSDEAQQDPDVVIDASEKVEDQALAADVFVNPFAFELASVRDGRVEWWSSDGTPVVLADYVEERRLVAAFMDGSVLLLGDEGDPWKSTLEHIKLDGTASTIPIEGEWRFLSVDVDLDDGSKRVQIMQWRDSDAMGDLVEWRLDDLSSEILQADAFYIDQNFTPISRRAGVVLSEYVWFQEWELYVSDKRNPDQPVELASPTDGRYGPSYGVFDLPPCPASDDQTRGWVSGVALATEGDRVVWLFETTEQSNGVADQSELSVLDVRSGGDGAIRLDPNHDRGRLMSVHGTWAIFSTGALNIGSTDFVDLETTQLVVPHGISTADMAAPLPGGAVPLMPRCSPELSIYGFGDLRVDVQPTENALTGTYSREGQPNGCRWNSGYDGIQIEMSGESVRAVRIDEPGFTTPSGFGVGSRLSDIWDQFSDRLVVVPHGVDPLAAPLSVDALDFEPEDDPEAHLGLRFVFREGVVTEIRGGERQVTRDGAACW